MRKTVLAGIFALSASTSLAQTGTAPEPSAPAGENDPTAIQAETTGPSNLCQELLAFMKAPPPEEAAPAKPAAASTEKPAPAQQEGAALDGTTESDEAASAKPEAGTNSAQEVTGQDGVATDAPEPSNKEVAAGSVANAPQKDSRSAPVPPADVTSTPKESVITVEGAEELAAANDIAVCQETAREMRVTGVSMPPPLIALTALDLQYQQDSGAEAPPSAADDPAGTEQDPASETPAPD